MFQKATWVLFIGILLGLTNCQLFQPKTEIKQDEHPLSKLTNEEKAVYWKNKDDALNLRALYIRYMNLIDSNANNMVTPESSERFLSLFEDYAKILNDLIPEPLPVSPADYVAFVRNFLPKGVNATCQRDFRSEDNIEDPRFFRYYRVGQGKQEYYMHFLIVKTMHVGLTKENRKFDQKPPKVLHLEMVLHFNEEKKTAKICEIKPMSN